jgi:hypothetical protein
MKNGIEKAVIHVMDMQSKIKFQYNVIHDMECLLNFASLHSHILGDIVLNIQYSLLIITNVWYHVFISKSPIL